MMFDNTALDNTPATAGSRWVVIREHLPMVALIAACLGIAGGIHLASTAIVVIAAGHLATAVALFAVGSLRSRNTGGRR